MKKHINLILTAIIALSTISGAWLISSPTIEKQDALNQQSKLIAAIEDRTNTLPPIFETVKFEQDDIDESEQPQIEIVETIPVPVGTSLGIVTIDKIDLKLPVVEGTETEQLKIAVGHVSETPIVGEIGNAVIAGHRNYTYGSMFNRLGEVEIGDIIDYAPIDGEPMQFRVFEIAEIEPNDQIAFVQPDDESIITLYTCTPIREATHRLLIRAIKY